VRDRLHLQGIGDDHTSHEGREHTHDRRPRAGPQAICRSPRAPSTKVRWISQSITRRDMTFRTIDQGSPRATTIFSRDSPHREERPFQADSRTPAILWNELHARTFERTADGCFVRWCQGGHLFVRLCSPNCGDTQPRVFCKILGTPTHQRTSSSNLCAGDMFYLI
jgi:hypothetical protein